MDYTYKEIIALAKKYKLNRKNLIYLRQSYSECLLAAFVDTEKTRIGLIVGENDIAIANYLTDGDELVFSKSRYFNWMYMNNRLEITNIQTHNGKENQNITSEYIGLFENVIRDLLLILKSNDLVDIKLIKNKYFLYEDNKLSLTDRISPVFSKKLDISNYDLTVEFKQNDLIVEFDYLYLSLFKSKTLYVFLYDVTNKKVLEKLKFINELDKNEQILELYYSFILKYGTFKEVIYRNELEEALFKEMNDLLDISSSYTRKMTYIDEEIVEMIKEELNAED